MSDEELRMAERKARATGRDENGKAAREQARTGQGLVFELRSMIGTWLYVEGARMNYRGRLSDVVVSPLGEIEALALEPCWRLGWWDSEGPRQGYNFKLKGRHLVPWDAVQAVGPSGKEQGGGRDAES